MSANVLAHPAPDMAELEISLKRLGVADSVVVMRGNTVKSEHAMRELTHSCWNLDDIDARYSAFALRFRPLMKAMSHAPKLPDKSAFLVRTLLIQEYRKILLRDPMLPEELLPSDWQGATAYQLCRNLYRELYMPADQYLTETMETADGPLPPPSSAFLARFGGLDKPQLRKISNG